MSLEAGRINLSQVQNNTPRVVVENSLQGQGAIRNDQSINVPLNAFIPGTPITGNGIKIIPYYTGVQSSGGMQILSQQAKNGVTVTHARNIAPGYNGVIIQGGNSASSAGPIYTAQNNYAAPATQKPTVSAAGGQYNKDYVAAQVEKFKKGRPESDGKFSFGQLCKNIGKGMLKEVENIGKALATPGGLLTAAAVAAVSIAFPPAGLVIAGGFLAYGIGKTAVGGYNVAKELANGNPDAAERKGKQIGEGLVDTGIAALGLRGALKSFKAWKAGPATNTGGTPPNQPGPNPNQKALPAPENTKALPTAEKGIELYKGNNTGNTGGGTGNTGGPTGTPGTNPRITQNTGNTNTGTSFKSGGSFGQQAASRINSSENVTFFDRYLGRTSQQTVKNPYKVLDIDPKNFSLQSLKQAHRKLAVEFHPDKAAGNEAYFKEIQGAYDILSNSARRGAMNEALGIK